MSSFHLIPVYLEAGWWVEHVTPRMRFGAPTMMAVGGVDADGERVWAVGFEWPDFYTRPVGNREQMKRLNEARHLARFRRDWANSAGSDLYDDRPASAGGDPPDFVIGDTAGGVAAGVEITQLVPQGRVEADAGFRQVRATVLAANRHSFRHLTGYVVYAAFEAGVLPRSAKAAHGVVQALRAFVPPDAPQWQRPEDMSQQLDPQYMPATFPGGSLTGARLVTDPGTPFYRMTGFELALAFSTTIRPNTAWEQLERLVGAHDTPGVDDLVVAAGAPNQSGFAYPSDELVARAVLDQAERATLRPQHVKRVFLHIWPDQSIHQLTPPRSASQPRN